VDPLTGLYNKRWMIETVTREIRRVQRYGAPLSLAVVDLDGLKCVNDQHGHLAGDSALRHVSGRISAGLRELDSAARIGGDEFVVLLPNTDLPGAQHVGRRILTAIRKDAAQHKDVPLTISASIGIAQWEPGWQPSDLIDAADVAMYRAKQRGRNQIVCRPTSGGAGKSPGMPAPGGAAVNATARLHG
jgi:diguanylate cyclase (GGDEF)-like protein